MKLNQTYQLAFMIVGLQFASAIALANELSSVKSDSVVVPKVVGMSVKQAREALEKVNLTFSAGKHFKDSDRVLHQSIAGKTVPAGTEIKLVPGVRVPSFIRGNAYQVKRSLANSGVKIKIAGVKKVEYSTGLTENDVTVIGQSVRPGTYVPRGETIKILLQHVGIRKRWCGNEPRSIWPKRAFVPAHVSFQIFKGLEKTAD